MDYSPKLKRAMEKIKAILNEEDIAAAVVLHTPGHSEYYSKIDPSYSAARFVQVGLDTGVRFRATAADFGGDKEKCRTAQVNTMNMLHHLSEVTNGIADMFKTVTFEFGKATGAEHFGGGHTSHTQQNN